MDASGLTNGVDRIEAGFDKSHPDVEFEASKRLAELPPGTVQNAHHTLPCRRLARSSFYGTSSEQSGCEEASRSLPRYSPVVYILVMAICSPKRIRQRTWSFVIGR